MIYFAGEKSPASPSILCRPRRCHRGPSCHRPPSRPPGFIRSKFDPSRPWPGLVRLVRI